MCKRGDGEQKVRMACRCCVPHMEGAPEVHCISSILPPSTRTYFISFSTLPRHKTHSLFDIMGESRMELVAWLNDLLQLNYRKVEQAGTGRRLHSCHVARTRSLIVATFRCCVLSSYGFNLW